MGMNKRYLNTYFYAKFDIYSAQKKSQKDYANKKHNKKQKIKEIMTFTMLRKISLQVFDKTAFSGRQI